MAATSSGTASGSSSAAAAISVGNSSVGGSSLITTSSISTIYSTNIYTVTSCAPEVKNCPGKGVVTTELVSLYTTICPVTNKVLDGITYPPVNAIVAAPTSSPAIASSSSPGMSSASASVPLNLSSSSAVLSASAAPGSSSAAPSSPPPMMTSTVFTSSVYTVSSCAPGAAECSSMMGSVTAEQVALYTTVCPVKESSAKPLDISTTAVAPVLGTGSSAAAAPAISPVVVPVAPYANASVPHNTSGPLAPIASQAPLFTTSTVVQTNIYTVTSCGPEVKNCAAKLGAVTTEIIALSTTVCPVTQSAVAPVAAGAAQPSAPPPGSSSRRRSKLPV
ncbi:hypothetical protein PG994_010058 [Apiospora phragmitis]|uniref:Uncharacterized protein n=1 Tax=Apiospora phragmitis TaxID=2905665 RepID=A0ABR1TNU2_9PEZI